MTGTRGSLPAATSPRSLLTDTVKLRRRPSTRASVASARTVTPMGTGMRWSSCTRIPTLVTDEGKAPEAVKGICASAKTRRIYVSTTARLFSLDMDTERVLRSRAFQGG